MPISPYVRELRTRIGTTRLLLPSVSAHVFDDAGRLLLVRQRDDGIWSTPGGTIEPDERPADAVVRETWEETGLVVSPTRLLAVYGGPEFVVRYPSGDESQYVIAAFECRPIGGAVSESTDETVAARYWAEADAAALPLAPWLRSVLRSVFAEDSTFLESQWSPTGTSRD